GRGARGGFERTLRRGRSQSGGTRMDQSQRQSPPPRPGGADMSAVIAMHNLTKRFGSKTVVDQLTLDVPQGAIYAFLGDNGAGKTSTIKVLVGMHPPDGGTAKILGQDCW